MKSSNKLPASKLVEMGVIGKPHGLQGEVAVRWEGEAPVPVGGEVWLRKGMEDPVAFRIEAARPHKGNPLICLAGVGDRTSAEELRGAKIFVPRASLVQPEEDEAWLEDLLEADIFLENGQHVGRLDHLEYPAGQEIWVIKNAAGKEILFPARPEFITSIDAESGKVYIAPPPGLLDIYLA